MHDYKDWTPRELLVELHSKFQALAIFSAEMRRDSAAALLLERSSHTIAALLEALSAPASISRPARALVNTIADLDPAGPLDEATWDEIDRRRDQCLKALEQHDPRLAPRCIPPQTTVTHTGSHRAVA